MIIYSYVLFILMLINLTQLFQDANPNRNLEPCTAFGVLKFKVVDS